MRNNVLVKAAERHGPERDLPQRVVDLLERDVLLAQHMGDVHPVIVPADAAVATDAPHLAMRWILERREARRIRARRGRVAGRGRPLRERFVGALVVVLPAKTIEAALLRGAIRAGGRVASALSVLCMRSCRPFCSGCPGSMSSGRMPRRIHQTLNGEQARERRRREGHAVVAAEPRGRPYVRKSRSKTGRASAVRTDVSARHASR